ncbi:hypothetical protein JDN40_10230 [Rhodomicrobium vannielii ATCC 17100]|uniref:hypothetical protein n=1 Tax=Rhodomicrobium vannielii TaxID=1069 RepID=UPI00191921C0|nr:hypothetical protein [Rhodomicrobium vannielii]MBJ7534480.1 hypothetical protein [Rhodomicrobium vannielii ATCC 17100]
MAKEKDPAGAELAAKHSRDEDKKKRLAAALRRNIARRKDTKQTDSGGSPDTR